MKRTPPDELVQWLLLMRMRNALLGAILRHEQDRRMGEGIEAILRNELPEPQQ